MTFGVKYASRYPLRAVSVISNVRNALSRVDDSAVRVSRPSPMGDIDRSAALFVVVVIPDCHTLIHFLFSSVEDNGTFRMRVRLPVLWEFIIFLMTLVLIMYLNLTTNVIKSQKFIFISRRKLNYFSSP